MLGIIRIEVVQSIQKVDNSVPLTASRRTAVRVFVDSGITSGFDWGNGPNRVADVSVSVVAERLAGGGTFGCGPAWPGSAATPTPNRDLLADSFNFDVPLAACNGPVRFHAFAEWRRDPAQPPQTLGDRRGRRGVHAQGLSGAPADADRRPVEHGADADDGRLLRRLQRSRRAGARPAVPGRRLHRQPAAVVHARLGREPQVGLNWSLLVARIATMIFLFPNTPVGGIRSGDRAVRRLVPLGRDGAAAGRRRRRRRSSARRASRRRARTSSAHAFGYLHVNCGGPAGPYDANLPLTISDPGIDVAARTIVMAGSSELMTYCGPQWPSVEHWTRLFNSIPI